MSEQGAPQQNRRLLAETVTTCSQCKGRGYLPESQPSPSGDAREWCLRNKGHQFVEEYCSAEIYDCMTEFAKVSGKAEQRLRLQEAVHELIAAERKLLPVCPIVTHHKSDCVYCDLIGKRISVEAALQESHSGR